MPFYSVFLALPLLAAWTSAAPQLLDSTLNDADAVLDLNLSATLNASVSASIAADQYAPYQTACPTEPIVRPASGISTDEANYVAARKVNADKSLAAWLSTLGNFSSASQPVVAFASSGGGLRALLETAGVVQAIDSRDSSYGTSGLYQGLTYESGLSGGAWFLSSLSGNNWPTVTDLLNTHWKIGFLNGLILPANLLNDTLEYVPIVVDTVAKGLAGFTPTIIDVYGRLLSYQFLSGFDGGVGVRLSSLRTLSNFTSYNVAYPIMTTTGIDEAYQEECFPPDNTTIYEFHPYEYGSWDHGVAAFAKTEYMGSRLSNGVPVTAGECVANYDNIGYIFGTSSNIFNYLCTPLEPLIQGIGLIKDALMAVVALTHDPTFEDLFGTYPNPFYNYSHSSLVAPQQSLSMADGGDSNQNIPIWPFIQPARHVDVLIASDNSADADNFPNGSDPRQTWVNAQAAGLTRMPFIPEASVFVSEGLNKRAAFFGCPSSLLSSNTASSTSGTSSNSTSTNSSSHLLLIYLPNAAYVYQSNTSTFELEYNFQQTDGMIANGNAIATQNGTAGWPLCLACGVKWQDGLANLPAGCGACFEKYCYVQ